MKLIDDIRIKAGEKSLAKEVKLNEKRNAKVINLADANSIALLFKIETEEDYSRVSKFQKYLKSEFGTKRVFFLGYWDHPKEDPEFLQSKLDFDFFTRKQLNWKGVPSGGNIDNFIKEKYDIIIDLNDYLNVPLRYLVLKSNSMLRVGRNTLENEPYFDVMLCDDKTGFEDLCNELVKYLTMLNSK